MTDVNVTVTEPTIEVIAVNITEPNEPQSLVTVQEPVVQVVDVNIEEPPQIAMNIVVSDPVTEVVNVRVIGGGISNSSVPDGGVAGQVLAKASAINQDMIWVNNTVAEAEEYLDQLLDVHISDTANAHVAQGISFVPPTTAPINGWFTATDVQTGLLQVASQLYSPDQSTMEAMIAAANALAGGAGQEFSNPDLFASDVIVTRHMLAGSISAAILDVTTLNAMLVSANALYSNNYVYVSGPYSEAGTFFDLSNGNLTSEQFSVVNGVLTIASEATIGTLTAGQLADKQALAAVTARLENMVTNGDSGTYDNTNFTDFVFDGTEAGAGRGMFTHTQDPYTGMEEVFTDENYAVDPLTFYRFSYFARQIAVEFPSINLYHDAFVVSFDADNIEIESQHVAKHAGSTLTRLAADLNNGDTTITLTDATGWYNGSDPSMSSIGFFPYTAANGYVYSEYTYTRDGLFGGQWAASGITGNVITLAAAYSGPTIPTGTAVANMVESSDYDYVAAEDEEVPDIWTKFQGVIGGRPLYALPLENDVVDSSLGVYSADDGFRWGTFFTKIGWMLHKDGDTSAPASTTQGISGVEYGPARVAPADVNDNVTSISGDSITTGTVNTDRLNTTSIATQILTADSITSGMIDVTSLSAIAADLGSISGGEINIGGGKFIVNSAGNLSATDADISGTIQGYQFELYDNVPGIEELQSEWQTFEDPFDAGVVNNSLLFRHNDVPGSNNVGGFYWDSDNTGCTWFAASTAGGRSTYIQIADNVVTLTIGSRNISIGSGGISSNGNWVFNQAVLSDINEVRAASGTSGDPAFTFDDDQTSGFYLSSGSPAITNSGSRVAHFQSGSLQLYGTGDERLRLYGSGANEGSYVSLWDNNSRLGYMGFPGGVNLYVNNEIGYVTRMQIRGEIADFNSVSNGMQLEIYAPSTSGTASGAGYYASNTGLLVRTKNDALGVGEVANIGIWTQHSTDRHAILQVWEGSGDQLRVVDAENTGFIPIRASAFTVSSTEKLKRRIRTGREESGWLHTTINADRKWAFRQFKKLRPILWDDAVQESLTEWLCDEHASREDCDSARCPNRIAKKKQHVCSEYICSGTDNSPCFLVEQHIDRPGLSAEELLEIWPKAVYREADGSAGGIDYAVVTTELINTIQHLLEDRDEARAREAKLSWAVRKLEHKLKN